MTLCQWTQKSYHDLCRSSFVFMWYNQIKQSRKLDAGNTCQLLMIFFFHYIVDCVPPWYSERHQNQRTKNLLDVQTKIIIYHGSLLKKLKKLWITKSKLFPNNQLYSVLIPLIRWLFILTFGENHHLLNPKFYGDY